MSNRSSFNSGLGKVARSKITLVVVILVIILAVFTIIKITGNKSDNSSDMSSIATTGGSSGSLAPSSVKVTGKIAPVTKSELGFDRSGVVGNINVRVGDMVKAGDLLVALDSYEAQASVVSAAANLAAEEANYKELERGLRTEEYGVERAKVVSAEVDLNDATLNAQNALRESLIGADKAMRTYIGTFFTNSYASFPDFNLYTKNQDIERYISNEQTKINIMFTDWKMAANEPSYYSDPLTSLRKVRSNLESLKAYFTLIGEQVAYINTQNTTYTSDEIADYRTTMTLANELLNTVFDEVVTAEGQYLSAVSVVNVARNEFNLKKSGTSSENLDVARAKTDKARADLDNARAQLSKTRLISPIDGIVSLLDVDKGEAVTNGKVIVNVISNEPFKIEVFVPEVDIANVKIGATAEVTLDAYGPDSVWKATVSTIDPAETIVEGVPTYKVTLRLSDSDARIKSGMTANIAIAI